MMVVVWCFTSFSRKSMFPMCRIAERMLKMALTSCLQETVIVSVAGRGGHVHVAILFVLDWLVSEENLKKNYPFFSNHSWKTAQFFVWIELLLEILQDFKFQPNLSSESYNLEASLNRFALVLASSRSSNIKDTSMATIATQIPGKIKTNID